MHGKIPYLFDCCLSPFTKELHGFVIQSFRLRLTKMWARHGLPLLVTKNPVLTAYSRPCVGTVVSVLERMQCYYFCLQ